MVRVNYLPDYWSLVERVSPTNGIGAGLREVSEARPGREGALRDFFMPAGTVSKITIDIAVI